MNSIQCPFLKTVRKERLYLPLDDVVAQRLVTRSAELQGKTVSSTQSLSKNKHEACVILDLLEKIAAFFCKANVLIVTPSCSTSQQRM